MVYYHANINSSSAGAFKINMIIRIIIIIMVILIMIIMKIRKILITMILIMIIPGAYHYHANINCSNAGAATGANDPDTCKLIGDHQDIDDYDEDGDDGL